MSGEIIAPLLLPLRTNITLCFGIPAPCDFFALKGRISVHEFRNRNIFQRLSIRRSK